jgi:hypothetical protein
MGVWTQEFTVSGKSQLREQALKERYDALGWTPTELAKAVAKVRLDLYGEEVDPRNISKSIQSALERPSSATTKLTELIIIAMEGTMLIEWTDKIVVETTRLESLSGKNQPAEEL